MWYRLIAWRALSLGTLGAKSVKVKKNKTIHNRRSFIVDQKMKTNCYWNINKLNYKKSCFIERPSSIYGFPMIVFYAASHLDNISTCWARIKRMNHSDSEPKLSFSNYSKGLRSMTLIQVWAEGVRYWKVPHKNLW